MAEEKRSSATDTSDIEKKILETSDIEKKILEQNVPCYDVLLTEFEPKGDRKEHVVSGGKDHVGKLTEKQEWSKFCFHYLHCLINCI
jgi:hypothetical protein